MRFTWKKEDRERGLAGVFQGERGYNLRLNGKVLAHVRPLFSNGKSREKVGYYFYTIADVVPGANSCNQPCHTVEKAKVECLDYVKKHLKVP